MKNLLQKMILATAAFFFMFNIQTVKSQDFGADVVSSYVWPEACSPPSSDKGKLPQTPSSKPLVSSGSVNQGGTAGPVPN